MIRDFIEARRPKSGNAVEEKLQLVFGHLCEEIIVECLNKMEADSVFIRRDGKAHAKHYHLAV